MSENSLLPTELAEALSQRLRRQLLIVLADRSTPISEKDLATALVERQSDRIGTSLADRDRVYLTLHHQHLPKLEDAGIVERPDGSESVTIASHPVFERADLLDDIRTAERFEGSLDAVFDGLADRRRRRVLSVLGDRERPISVDALAEDLAAIEPRGHGSDGRSDSRNAIVTLLHHVHLPKLRSAGLIDFDEAEGSVSIGTHPIFESEWVVALLETGRTDHPHGGDSPLDVRPVFGG